MAIRKNESGEEYDDGLPEGADAAPDPGEVNKQFRTAAARGWQSEIGNVNKGNSRGPYRGGLMQNFAQFGTSDEGLGRASAYGSDNDSDVKNAERAYYYMNHGDSGTSHNEQAALYNQYRGRIATKNSLAEQIAQNPDQLGEMESNLKSQAGESLGQGLKDTRAGYNRRGLLYSGMREGGEQKVRGAVGSQLARGLSGAKRESANSLSAAQNAYAAVGMANEQEALNLAHQAFDTASQNQIARMQAMQQLGHGIGSLAGTISGTYSGGQTEGSNNYSVGRQQTRSPEIGY